MKVHSNEKRDEEISRTKPTLSKEMEEVGRKLTLPLEVNNLTLLWVSNNIWIDDKKILF